MMFSSFIFFRCSSKQQKLPAAQHCNNIRSLLDSVIVLKYIKSNRKIKEKAGKYFDSWVCNGICCQSVNCSMYLHLICCMPFLLYWPLVVIVSDCLSLQELIIFIRWSSEVYLKVSCQHEAIYDHIHLNCKL